MADPKDLLKEPDPPPVETEEVKELKAKLATSETATQAARDEVTAAAEKAAGLEEAARRPVVRTPVPGVQRTAAEIQAETYEQIREGIYTAPGATLDEHFNRRMTPVLQDYYNTQAGVARELGLAKVSEADRTRYGDEAAELMKAVDPVTKANPNAWVQAFNLVKAQHLPEIIEQEKDVIRKEFEPKPPVIEGATPPPPPGGPAVAPLTEEEKMVCQRYVDDGVFKDEEEYKKWKVK
jgi:hypothetical protein